MATKIEYITGKRQIASQSWLRIKSHMLAVRVSQYENTLGEKDRKFEKGNWAQKELMNS